MKKVSSIELSVIKGIASASNRTSKAIAKIAIKKQALDKEIASLEGSIALMEEPIKTMTDGYTSREYLIALRTEATAEVIAEVTEESNEEVVTEDDTDMSVSEETTGFVEEEKEEDLQLDLATIADDEEVMNESL